MKKIISVLTALVLMSVMFTSCFPKKLAEYDDSATKEGLVALESSEKMTALIKELRIKTNMEFAFQETPHFDQIDAAEGIQYVVGAGMVVKIYRYETEADLEKALDEFDVTENFTHGGTFLLETNDNNTKKFFTELTNGEVEESSSSSGNSSDSSSSGTEESSK